MVACYFYAQGYCKFGDNCANQHVGSTRPQDRHGYIQFPGNPRSQYQTQTAPTGPRVPKDCPFTPDTLEMNMNELPEWKLTSYGAANFEPNVLGGLDMSPEEIRLAFYHLKRTDPINGLSIYTRYVTDLENKADAVYSRAKANARTRLFDEALALYKEKKANEKKLASQAGSSDGQVQPSSWPVKDRPTVQSAFGPSGSGPPVSSSAFGGAPSTPARSGPVVQSAFGPGGSGPPVQSSTPAGAPTATRPVQSAFGPGGSGPPVAAGSSTRVQSAFGPGGSGPPVQSAFGAPASSAFGARPTNTQSAFGASASSAVGARTTAVQSAFGPGGSGPPPQPPFGTFGATGTARPVTSAFGAGGSGPPTQPAASAPINAPPRLTVQTAFGPSGSGPPVQTSTLSNAFQRFSQSQSNPFTAVRPDGATTDLLQSQPTASGGARTTRRILVRADGPVFGVNPPLYATPRSDAFNSFNINDAGAPTTAPPRYPDRASLAGPVGSALPASVQASTRRPAEPRHDFGVPIDQMQANWVAAFQADKFEYGQLPEWPPPKELR